MEEEGLGRTVRTDNLSRDEQFMLALHDLVLSAFRQHFGEETIIAVGLTPLVSECWITVQVKQKAPEMEDLARALKTEFLEELGRHVAIFVRQPWKATVTNLTRRILNLGR